MAIRRRRLLYWRSHSKRGATFHHLTPSQNGQLLFQSVSACLAKLGTIKEGIAKTHN